MKHARDDYNRIQDPAGLIPENEPVFLIRGQDAFAPALLRMYADAVEMQNGDINIVVATRNQAVLMEQWQKTNKIKMPDMPKDEG